MVLLKERFRLILKFPWFSFKITVEFPQEDNRFSLITLDLGDKRGQEKSIFIDSL